MKKLFSAALCLLACVTLAAYEMIVFGDVHFDSDEVRDSKAKLSEHQEKEKMRNLQNWAKDIPALMDRGAAKAGKDTAFVLQLGDIVQGDCGSQQLHEKSVNTVLAIFLKRFPDIRFLTVRGNHDVRGKGAFAGYEAVMLPYLGKTLNHKFSAKQAVQYALMQDKDLYVFLDCKKPDLKFLEKSIAAHPERRHLFVAIHFPVIPVAPGTSMTLFGHPDKPELRKQLIDLLAKNNAIVLCAHIHAETFVRWQNESGSITQVTFSSIFPSKVAEPKLTDRDPKNPFSKISRRKMQAMKALMSDFLPGYKGFTDIQPSAGFSILKPSDKDVILELYNTEALTPTHTLKLK